MYLHEDHTLPVVKGVLYVRSAPDFIPADKVGLGTITGEVMRSGGTPQHSGDWLDDRLAAIGAFIARRTRCGADILPLVPKTTGALSHPKTAGFAKIILPRITCFSASRPVQR